MKIEEIFDNIDYDTGGYYSVTINKYKEQAIKLFEQLEADKLEMAKAIVEDNTLYYFTEDGENGGKYCGKCGLDYPNHSDDCIVNKADKYIKEVEK